VNPEPTTYATGSIVLVGQGRWIGELAKGLAQYASLDVDRAPFDTITAALSLTSWRAIARAGTVVVVGFRPGARTIRGVLFDAVFSVARRLGPRKRVIYYWIGSDVQRARAEADKGRSRRFARAVEHDEHYAGSDVLAHELAAAGVRAQLVDFPWLGMPDDARPLPLPEKFTVLSYVPDARSDFYGGPQLLEAARALPELSMLIVGGKGDWAPSVPDNVTFLGWQEDMRQWYEASSVVVRLVEYDSIGGTVVEALAYGRAALYSKPLEHTTYVPFGDVRALVDALSALVTGYRGSLTPPDAAASEWVRSAFDPARLFKALAHRITAPPMSQGQGSQL